MLAFGLKYVYCEKERNTSIFLQLIYSEMRSEFCWDDHGLTYWTNYVICYTDRFTNPPCFPSISPIWSLVGDSFTIELVFLLFSLRLIYFTYEIRLFLIKINEYIYK